MATKVFALKKSRSDKGDSIIVSFAGRWNAPLRESGFSIVFRKHHPSQMDVRWIYAYCARPISAIVARMPVRSAQRLPMDEAVKLCGESMHTEDEIREYAKSAYRNYTSLVVYSVGKIEYTPKPVTMHMLADAYDFWPSSTFTPLSESGKQIIDRLAGFDA